MSTVWANFKKAKNKVTKLIWKSKETYFESKVAENRHNPRKLWHLIKGLSKEGDYNEEIQRLIEGEELFSEKTKITETLKSFFLNQQSNLNPISENDIVPLYLPSYTSVVNGDPAYCFRIVLVYPSEL